MSDRGRTGNSYIKMNQKEHVYKIPDTYIGSTEKTERDSYLFDFQARKISYQKVTLPSGVERLFLEIISNAGDNVDLSRRAKVDPGKITVLMNRETISIENEGLPIPIEMNDAQQMWAPALIFGELLTSSNYDTSIDRTGCGRNGYGAKATNIFSKGFLVEIGDHIRKKSYRQYWTDNMNSVSEPEIADYKGSSYVRITYTMDFERFGYTEYPDEAFGIYAYHCLNMALTSRVPITFNGESLTVGNVKDYASLIYPQEIVDRAITYYQWPAGTEVVTRKGGQVAKDPFIEPIIELCLLDTCDEAIIWSFVNGIPTFDGGVHVEAVYKAVGTNVLEAINPAKKKKDDKPLIKLTMADIKPHLSIILNTHLVNPKFNSQTKNTLTSPAIKIDIPEKTLQPISKWDLVQRLYATLEAKKFKTLSKSDGKKKKYVDIDGSSDANWAGKEGSEQCCLYIVEGKSASAYAKKLYDMQDDLRNTVGVHPLRGKLLNVMNASVEQIYENKVIENLKKILGLQELMDYSLPENFATLRYGRVNLMADADVDGKHIISLVLNMFHCRYPTLLHRGYVWLNETPILRLTMKGKKYKFFSTEEYDQWLQEDPARSSVPAKYFKGLGTSKDDDIQDDFEHPRFIQLTYDDLSAGAFSLSFHKKLADRRKQWIASSIGQSILPYEQLVNRPISVYLEKIFVQYPISNLHRSIPSMTDGLKTSQRKALWGSFLKWKSTSDHLMIQKSPTELKVAQLAGYVANETHYHHGEKNLEELIVGMTHNFVGSNNLPYFIPEGQFGSRDQGGKDASDARYIFTKPQPWLNLVFKKEDLDLLPKQEDEGEVIEPEYLLPIVPMSLINGCEGIGSGHSTFIPAYNPLDIINWLLRRMDNVFTPRLVPWYRGFKGTIELRKKKVKELDALPIEEGGEPVEETAGEAGGEEEVKSMVTTGVFTVNKKGVRVVELPIRVWTESYLKWIMEQIEKTKTIKKFNNFSKSNSPIFDIFGHPNPNHQTLKLTKAYGLTNMVLLDDKKVPRHYEGVEDILEHFYQFRLPFFEQRRQLNLQKIHQKLMDMYYKIKFITLVINKTINPVGLKKADLVAILKSQDLPASLSSMTFNHTTEEEILELRKEYAKVEQEKAEYEKLTASDLWRQDLNDFKVEYLKYK